MITKLRETLDNLFQDAPNTRRALELKEEILQNLTDKYNDSIAQGHTPETAYNLAVASVGEVNVLIEDLKKETWQDPGAVKARQKSAIFVSIAVMFYILCPVPLIVLGNTQGLVALFSMVAVATGLIIYNSLTKPRYAKQEDSVVEDFKQWNSENKNRKQAFKAISSALWTVTVALYMVISFTTGAWHISWIIFLIASALTSVLKAIFDLTE